MQCAADIDIVITSTRSMSYQQISGMIQKGYVSKFLMLGQFAEENLLTLKAPRKMHLKMLSDEVVCCK